MGAPLGRGALHGLGGDAGGALMGRRVAGEGPRRVGQMPRIKLDSGLLAPRRHSSQLLRFGTSFPNQAQRSRR